MKAKTKVRSAAKRRAEPDASTISQAAIQVARSGARLAKYSAKFALAKAEGAWHSVAERAHKLAAK